MKTTNYSAAFRQDAVKKYLSSDTSYPELGKKLGISSSTLHGWVKKYGSTEPVKKLKPKKIKKWTPEEKLEAIIKTSLMSDDELGQYLRSVGLTSDDLQSFKTSFIDSQSTKGRPKLDPELVKLRKEVKSLNSNLKKKDRALAEYSARVILLKKSHEIWGTNEEEQ